MAHKAYTTEEIALIVASMRAEVEELARDLEASRRSDRPAERRSAQANRRKKNENHDV